MRFKLEVNMDNDAFYSIDPVSLGALLKRGRELARILRHLSLRIENDANFEPGEGATVQDDNGNSVGEWSVHA